MPTPLVILIACTALCSISICWQSNFERFNPGGIFLRWCVIFVVSLVTWWYWNSIQNTLDRVVREIVPTERPARLK